MSPTPSASSKKQTNGTATGTAATPYVNGNQHHLMDRGPEYSQSGLHSPYPAFASERHSEESSADQASAVQYQTASATPNQEYSLNSSAARQGTFPDYVPRQIFASEGSPKLGPSSNRADRGTMSEAGAPSLPLANGQLNGPSQVSRVKSDADIPIDPNIAAATSPGYPPSAQQYAPYSGQPHEMAGYPSQPQSMYARTGWPSPYQDSHAHGLPGQYVAQPSPTTTVSSASSAAQIMRHPHPGGPQQGQVNYSFVPIPGSQQNKRPRRRYEEIERMYKCGHNGCEKAYGTLNHLNAHVTMQGHGQKRTPEEFKEIRKEWKQRKKEEENARKADEERARNAAQSHMDHHNPADGPQGQPPVAYNPQGRPGPQLPPIGFNQQPYPTTQAQGPGQYVPQPVPTDRQFNPYPNYATNPYDGTAPVYQR
ncbi:MAG: hypothetical protein M1814_004430 [Vezdaea aestivalis]|nr:MAG: hypothetical protein M1814_004430 [Vezdaea aestivalis]